MNEAAQRGKVQRDLIKKYKEKLLEHDARKQEQIRLSRLSKTVATLTTDDILSPNAFWKMIKATAKNTSLKLQAVNKREGGIATNETEIKSEVGKEFVHRLRNRDPAEGWEGYVTATNEIVENLMNVQTDDGEPFTIKELENAVKKMKSGIAPDYYGMHSEIIIHAGPGLLKPLLQVFNIIRKTKEIPVMWKNVLITMIYKNKGSRMDLEKYRGIFLTDCVQSLREGTAEPDETQPR